MTSQERQNILQKLLEQLRAGNFSWQESWDALQESPLPGRQEFIAPEQSGSRNNVGYMTSAEIGAGESQKP